jgi:hypothetical protein
MNYTTNYNLNKPEATDQYNIQHFNDNADAIDTQMKTNANAITALDSAAMKKANNLSDLNDKSTAMTNVMDSFTAATDNNVNSDNIEFMSRKTSGSTKTWYKTKFSSLWNYIAEKISSVLGLTSSNYNGKSATAGTADDANKLNSNAGSLTQPVYFDNGIPKATTYALNKTVPTDAKFTDHEYDPVTQSANGLMLAADKVKLDNLNSDLSHYNKFTYIVDSNQKLADWANNVAGNDYTSVLVKKGTWTLNASKQFQIELNNTNTKLVYFEEGAKIISIDNKYVNSRTNALFAFVLSTYPNSPFDYPIIYNGNAEITSSGAIICFSLNCRNKNCHCTLTSNKTGTLWGVAAYQKASGGYAEAISCSAETTDSTYPRLYLTRVLSKVLFCYSETLSIIDSRNVRDCVCAGYSSSYSSPIADPTYACANTPNGGYNTVGTETTIVGAPTAILKTLTTDSTACADSDYIAITDTNNTTWVRRTLGTLWTWIKSKMTAANNVFIPTSSGTAGQVLVSGGSGNAPSWTSQDNIKHEEEYSMSLSNNRFRINKPSHSPRFFFVTYTNVSQGATSISNVIPYRNNTSFGSFMYCIGKYSSGNHTVGGYIGNADYPNDISVYFYNFDSGSILTSGTVKITFIY